MTREKDYALVGYITGTAVLTPFFWFTLGDAYGRFMIDFAPGQSMVSEHLVYYTSGATGLVCLAAPFLLAYLPRYVIGHWVEAAYDLSARTGLWVLASGRRLVEISRPQLSRVACTLWNTVAGKLRRLSRFFIH